MSERIFESEVQTIDGVDSLRMQFDATKLEEFQKTLSGSINQGMNKFIQKLNGLEALNKNAERLRQSQRDRPITVTNGPQVGGVVIPLQEGGNPEIETHNATIRQIQKEIQDFDTRRQAFLSDFLTSLNPQKPTAQPSQTVKPAAQPARAPRRGRTDGGDYFSDAIERQRNATAIPADAEGVTTSSESRYQAFKDSPDGRKIDAYSDKEVTEILAGFRTQGLGKAVVRYEGLPDREVLSRVYFDMKTGSIQGRFSAALKNIFAYLSSR